MAEHKVGDIIKCGGCHKKVTVRQVIGGGLLVINAPCGKCYDENMISSEKWERGPAEVDMLNQSEVVRYMRDLMNLNPLLENGADAELEIFMEKLTEAGYSFEARMRLLSYASTNTRYDYITDPYGKKLVPRVIDSSGY